MFIYLVIETFSNTCEQKHHEGATQGHCEELDEAAVNARSIVEPCDNDEYGLQYRHYKGPPKEVKK